MRVDDGVAGTVPAKRVLVRIRVCRHVKVAGARDDARAARDPPRTLQVEGVLARDAVGSALRRGVDARTELEPQDVRGPAGVP